MIDFILQLLVAFGWLVLIISIPYILWTERSTTEPQETTYTYCETRVSDDAPPQQHAKDYVLPKHRVVLEQSQEGEYRIRDWDTVIDSE